MVNNKNIPIANQIDNLLDGILYVGEILAERIRLMRQLSMAIEKLRSICPDCGGVLVKSHIELSDGSGWASGYLCDCEYMKEEL